MSKLLTRYPSRHALALGIEPLPCLIVSVTRFGGRGGISHRPRFPRRDPATQEGPMAEESYTGEAYCVKCKAKREFTGHVEETNGRRFAKGICPTCGTKVTRILGKA
jgi:hypothetical protein